MSEVVVVGGGMLGLVLSLRLRQQGHVVTLLEGAPAVGGLAAADEIGAVRWDRFYHVVLAQDTRLLSLLREIGLGDQMRWGATRTGFYVAGTWHSMTTALDFLRFPPLSLAGKLRLGATILAASRIRDWRSLEEVTALEWLTRWSGQRTVDAIWAPLLRSKLGANAAEASAAFIWAIIVRLYGARDPGLRRGESMGYVAGGYDRVIPVLRRFVERAGVRVVTGAMVSRVEATTAGVAVQLGDGSRVNADDVVLTVPCPRVAAMVPGLTDAERLRLQRVVYQGVVCPSFLLRRPLRGYYVTNITDGDMPFTGVIETTALVDRAETGGHHLVYLPQYLTQDDPSWGDSDASVVARSFAGLQRMIPDLQEADIVATRVARAREVLAVSTRRYSSELMPPLRTSVPHVFVANTAQIAHGTLNVHETIGLAERAAHDLAPHLATAPEVAHV